MEDIKWEVGDENKLVKLRIARKVQCTKACNKLDELLETEQVDWDIVGDQIGTVKDRLQKLGNCSDQLWCLMENEDKINEDAEKEDNYRAGIEIKLKMVERLKAKAVEALGEEPTVSSAKIRDSLEAQRKCYKTSCLNAVERLERELTFERPQPSVVQAVVLTVTKLLGQIENHNLLILNHLSPDEYGQQVEAEIQFEETVRSAINRANRFLEDDKESSTNNLIGASQNMVKLPALHLPVFDNTCAGFMEFWDIFAAAIDRNEALDNVNKLTYLKMQLRGEAKELVKHLPMLNDSYKVAIGILKEAFENKLLISLELIRKLDKLGTMRHTKEGLSAFRAELTGLLGTFDNLGYSLKGHEGSEMLITALMLTRMPQSLMDSLLRTNKSNITTLDGFKEALNLEVELLASGKTSPSNNRGENQSQNVHKYEKIDKTVYQGNKSVTDSFNINAARQLKPKQNQQQGKSHKSWLKKSCILCSEAGHKSTLCTKYVSVDSRKKRLAVLKRCTNCMSLEHSGRCDITCFVCGGVHALPVCYKNVAASYEQTPAEATVSQVGLGAEEVVNVCQVEVIRNSDCVVLPHLLVPVRNHSDNGYQSSHSYVNVNTLLDQGSQRTFILKSTVDKLNLRRLGYEKLAISTISGTQPEKEYELVEVPLVKGIYENVIEAIVVDALPKQKYSAGVVQKIAHLRQTEQGMALSSIRVNGVLEFEMLVGCDFYWQIVKAKQQVILRQGVYLMPTYYGYVLCGRVETYSGQHQQEMYLYNIGVMNL